MIVSVILVCWIIFAENVRKVRIHPHITSTSPMSGIRNAEPISAVAMDLLRLAAIAHSLNIFDVPTVGEDVSE